MFDKSLRIHRANKNNRQNECNNLRISSAFVYKKNQEPGVTLFDVSMYLTSLSRMGKKTLDALDQLETSNVE